MKSLSEEEFLEITKLHNPKKFSDAICSLVRVEGLGYMDAIIDYCVRHNIDTDIVPKLLSKSLKDKVEAEAVKFNFLPKTGSLPL
tara:strand:+ start:54 stop:308 length:255 start_codon:yes stop_codon:yes gene_type:complete